MSKQTFQIDGIGINKEHYAGMKKADFVKDILPSMPDRFGSDDQKKAWAEKAHDLMNPVEAKDGAKK